MWPHLIRTFCEIGAAALTGKVDAGIAGLLQWTRPREKLIWHGAHQLVLGSNIEPDVSGGLLNTQALN